MIYIVLYNIKVLYWINGKHAQTIENTQSQAQAKTKTKSQEQHNTSHKTELILSLLSAMYVAGRISILKYPPKI